MVSLQDQNLALGAQHMSLAARLEETCAETKLLDQKIERLENLKNVRDEHTRKLRSEEAWLRDIICTVQARPCTAKWNLRS